MLFEAAREVRLRTESHQVGDFVEAVLPAADHRRGLVQPVDQDEIVGRHARQRLDLTEEAGAAHAHFGADVADTERAVRDMGVDVLAEFVYERAVGGR